MRALSHPSLPPYEVSLAEALLGSTDPFVDTLRRRVRPELACVAVLLRITFLLR